jgi:hypothetical protein
MSIAITHDFPLADAENGRMEVTVEKNGSIRLLWWEFVSAEVGVDGDCVKKKMRILYIHRADFEQIAATVKMWDDVTIKKGLSNEPASR